MSLVGSLEDLTLGDILQIISLSRKSGILYLTGPSLSGGGQKTGARMIFRSGQVVSAALSTDRKRLGDLFMEKGLASPDQIAEALRIMSAVTGPVRLDEMMAERFGLDIGSLQSAVRSYLEGVVFSLFDWEEGDFNFDLKENDDDLIPFLQDPQEPVLDGGLNPQFLAMEGARQRDERKRPARQPEIPVGGGPAPEEAAPPRIGEAVPEQDVSVEPTPKVVIVRKIVLADDDPVTLMNLERIVADMGYEPHPVGSVRDALSAMETLSSGGEVPVLVADLIMPKQDGKGMLGGLELLEEVRKREPGSPILIITDVVDEDTERRVRELGGNEYLPKPRKSQVSRSLVTPAVRDFGEVLGRALDAIVPAQARQPEIPVEGGQVRRPEISVEGGQVLQGDTSAGQTSPSEGDKDSLTGLAEELKALEGIVDFLPEEAPRPPTTPGLQLLKSMIDELTSPRSHSDITLLILRFASEIMSRAVLFLVKKEEICGLGQFGIVLDGDNPERRVRAMRIPLHAPSIFRDVLDRRASMTKRPEETPWNAYIFDQLGGHKPQEVFLAPIFSGGRIVTILYGDNAPEDREIGDTTSLEIFLSQAGLALDRALLERKLKELKTKDKDIEWIGE